jgi:glycosyltransferase involved in cell wall biosynthesis/SAM-dependent methyltransferase
VTEPLVSIVMPFLNAERFIEEAVQSIFDQTYRDWELIFVDDGSSDASTGIALRYVEHHADKVRYTQHEGHRNRGIAASRNAGIRHTRGKYIAFLDSDDVWIANRLEQQVRILESQPQTAMVFGSTVFWHGWTGNSEDEARDFVPDPGVKTDTVYAPPELLLKLYPLGQATAPSMSNLLVRKEFIQSVGGFEEAFPGLYEDQTFLAKAYTRGHIFISSTCWDKYRIHPSSCLATESAQYTAVRNRFLDWFETWLRREGIRDPAILNALQKATEARSAPHDLTHYRGWLFRVADPSEAHLTDLRDSDGVRVVIARNESRADYDIQLNRPLLRVRSGHPYRVIFQARADGPRSIGFGVAMAREPWEGLGLYREIELTSEWLSIDEEFIAEADHDNARIHFDLGAADTAVELRAVRLCLPDGTPASGSVQFGNLRRVTPISREWGYDRGLPIDRHYIETWLGSKAWDIRGRVLEIGDSTYTRRFGGNRVSRSDVLDVLESNPRATVVGDLANAPQIPSGAFDCIILTQTLQFIYEVRNAIHTLHRILKPGGVVLATFPGISHNNDRHWNSQWYWEFTPRSARRLFEEAFSQNDVQVEGFGNVLTASSFLYGISAGELSGEELAYSELGYEVIVAVRARKAVESQ